MLDTLHLAYQQVLDDLRLDSAARRLSAEQQEELGKRLATYWLMRDYSGFSERKIRGPHPLMETKEARERGIAPSQILK